MPEPRTATREEWQAGRETPEIRAQAGVSEHRVVCRGEHGEAGG